VSSKFIIRTDGPKAADNLFGDVCLPVNMDVKKRFLVSDETCMSSFGGRGVIYSKSLANSIFAIYCLVNKLTKILFTQKNLHMKSNFEEIASYIAKAINFVFFFNFKPTLFYNKYF